MWVTGNCHWKGLCPVTVNVLEGSSLSFGHFIRCFLLSKDRFFLRSLSPTDPQVHGTLKCSLDELCDNLVAGAGRENHISGTVQKNLVWISHWGPINSAGSYSLHFTLETQALHTFTRLGSQSIFPARLFNHSHG